LPGKTLELIRIFSKLQPFEFYNIPPWGQCYTTFYGHNLEMFKISRSVFPGKLFQPSQMVMMMARAYLSGAPFVLFLWGRLLT